jgi:nitroimidazol reductase NimA-like FMN-containing flavoprotein (pyridoxamine 5'-phosphate oxidase superfamily)
MTAEEIDAFLAGERTCRVATVSASGRPHVAPLWFVWDGTHLWLHSIVKSQRWTDLSRNPEIAVVIDAETDYQELRGVEIYGQAVIVGEVPRTDTPDPALHEPELLFARKYLGGDEFYADRRHAWLRITPDKLTSWNFAKLTGT